MQTDVVLTEWNSADELPDAFVNLPRQVYELHPHWIPEASQLVRYMFSKDNPYFSQGKAWLGANGATRLAGFYSPHQLVAGKRAAYFGYWETLNDLGANQQLFHAFESWAKANGAEVIYGPINFSTHGSYRVRIDGFDQHCFIGEPYNPAYYPGILDSLGYKIDQLYASALNGDVAECFAPQKKLHETLEMQMAKQFTILPLTETYWLNNLDRLYRLSDEIFRANFAYTPISQPVFEQVCGSGFAKKICQHSSLVAETKKGEMAGIMLCFPDFSSLVCQGVEHKIDVDQLSFAEHSVHLPKPKRLLLKTAGVVHAHRGKHLYSYLFYGAIRNAIGHYDETVSCLYKLDNPSRKASDRLNGVERHYALYVKEL